MHNIFVCVFSKKKIVSITITINAFIGRFILALLAVFDPQRRNGHFSFGAHPKFGRPNTRLGFRCLDQANCGKFNWKFVI